jgi:hypothetical protein
MNALWAYFWPVFGLGLVLGAVFGALWLRRKRLIFLIIGLAVAIGGTGLWHGPLGAADRFAAIVDKQARSTLVAYEMGQVQAHLHRGPLTRHLVLAGPADDFQTQELVLIMDELPGVSRATWSANDAGIPLVVEGAGLSLLGFLVGLLLAYVVERRRRYNAQWEW